ncbi:DegT/DnrJ/EryC1/StrS family aminotransferase [Methylobacterium nigriterrae]|uniref:DegT/DnrJ/EryC1/StrS family aminotransferase n=1 Tax=Methylobacterium nigriterrae TaxID=3127512 RepID=UPI003013E66D
MLMVAGPVLGSEEKSALASVVDSGWITMGERVREFEREFARAHGVKDAVAVSSCTSGLHLVLLALGIGPGDEVLVPSMTFVATVNCIVHVRAKPVFVDIEALDRPVMSRDDAARKCTDRTRAVILVHYAGYVLDRDDWREFARSRGLRLIEDAAHAAGATGAGPFGDAAAFSFYGNKNMTTGEGGMVVAEQPDVLDRIRTMRSHGMTAGTFQRTMARNSGYDVTAIGFNCRMDEFRAAVGLVQLQRLGDWNRTREQLTRLYVERLDPEILIPFTQDLARNAPSAYHIMPIVLPEGVDRRQVVDHLRALEIQTTMHYPPVHSLSVYRNLFKGVTLPVTEEFAGRELTVPLHPGMEPDDVQLVASALDGALSRTGKRPGSPARATMQSDPVLVSSV